MATKRKVTNQSVITLDIYKSDLKRPTENHKKANRLHKYHYINLLMFTKKKMF